GRTRRARRTHRRRLEDRGIPRPAGRRGRCADDPRVDEDGDPGRIPARRHGDVDPRRRGRPGAGGPGRPAARRL
ncbi:MAG: hypothetical protein AVDCRST_MAG27-1400, partial [uncultured Craurococcus sp.]